MTEPALLVADLEALYGPAIALKDATLSVMPNEAVALLGPNGAGKSTLLNCVARIHRRCTGTITAFGEDLLPMAPSAVARSGISYVRERAPVITKMTVDENLRLGEMLASRRSAPPLPRSEIWDCFPVLAERAHMKAGLLSGGQRQMLALAVAFLSRPRLLLLDEPSAGLSPLAAPAVCGAVQRMREDGLSILLAEQNSDWVAGMASRAYVLESGRVTTQAPVATRDTSRPEELADTNAKGRA